MHDEGVRVFTRGTTEPRRIVDTRVSPYRCVSLLSEHARYKYAQAQLKRAGEANVALVVGPIILKRTGLVS